MTKKIRDPIKGALKNAKQEFDKFKVDKKRSPKLEEWKWILKRSGFWK